MSRIKWMMLGLVVMLGLALTASAVMAQEEGAAKPEKP